MKTAKWMLMALICFFAAASAADAHMIWLTPDNNAAKPGDVVTVTLGFGHHFSPDEVMEKEDRMERVYAVSPDGTEIDLKAVTPAKYTFTPGNRRPLRGVCHHEIRVHVHHHHRPENGQPENSGGRGLLLRV